MSAAAPLVLVMGVAGCGKTTVGRLLAGRLGVPFVDADELHPPENVDKMRRGEPLDEADRKPWLAAVATEAARAARDGEGLVLACSALRRAYRKQIRADAPGMRVAWLDISPEIARTRLSARQGHFAGPALVGSQFAALEPPEDGRFDGARDPAVLADALAAWLRVG